MRLGPLTLKSNLFLSPLAGYTNLPFRLVVREIGGVGLCTTDLVNAAKTKVPKTHNPSSHTGASRRRARSATASARTDNPMVAQKMNWISTEMHAASRSPPYFFHIASSKKKTMAIKTAPPANIESVLGRQSNGAKNAATARHPPVKASATRPVCIFEEAKRPWENDA